MTCCRKLDIVQLRYKVVLLGVVPLVLAAALLASVVEREGRVLADTQVAEAEEILLAAKQDELRHVMELARGAIRELELSDRDDPAIHARALEILRGLTFGEDGYFYVYDLDGRCLMHARRPWVEGRDLRDLVDDIGVPVMQQLLAKARSGGGFLQYHWERPSRQRSSQKLGYVVPVPRWGWMLGTGIYLDEIETITHQIRTSSSSVIGETMLSIAVIAVLAAMAVAGLGVALNVTQQRLADSKLRMLNQQLMKAQQTERSRIARELHDGVMQDLIAVRFYFETALDELKDLAQPFEALDQGLAGLTRGVDEIRRISRALRPPLHGDELPTALEQVGAALARRTGVEVTVDASAILQPMSNEAAMALLQVARQALDNVEHHARATRVAIRLADGDRRGSAGITLTVSDDGCGFDVVAVEVRSGGGIGLSNMRDRIEALGGWLSIRSGPGGTEIAACLPDDVLEEDGGDAQSLTSSGCS